MKELPISRNPWSWIPSLYIAEGLPYFAVNTLTVIMYVNMGISMAKMAFFTGWLYLPWVIKPFWSPFVDLIKTKRWWIVSMQFLIGLSMASVAFFLGTDFFFASTLAVFWIMAFFSATHDVAADGFYMLSLNSKKQAAFVGVRSTFYRIASVIGQGGLVMLAGYLEQSTGEVPLAWKYIFLILSAFFLFISFYHYRLLPVTSNDKPVSGVTWKTLLKDFGNTFITFIKKPYFFSAIAFMLLYRFPEALCIKLVQPFLLAPLDSGGLSLTTSQVGFINGTVGVIALLGGGILGGLAISKGGLKQWLWPMAISLTLPCVLYCVLAMVQTDNIVFISGAVAIEQFGYGFGFSAYMLYLIYFCQGENSTSHYAFCTAFMALGMMIPGMFAGWIFEWLENQSVMSLGRPEGFIDFFWLVMFSCVFTFLAVSKVKISPDFGRK